jgi:hypothetical protein
MLKKAVLSITLYQLAISAKEYNPDGAPYATEAEAEAAKVEQAREWMGDRLDTDDLRRMIEDGDVQTEKDAADVEGIEDLEDDALIALAEQEIDFQGDIYPVTVQVEVDVYDLTEAIRIAGAAPTIFTVEDIADRFDGTPEEAADWLVNNRRRLDDILSERGNEAIDDLLAADGKLAPDDDGEPDPDAVKLFVFSGGVALGGPGRGFYYAPVDKDDAPRLGGRADDDALPIWGPFDSVMMAERGARDAFGAEAIYFVELDDTPDWLPPGY